MKKFEKLHNAFRGPCWEWTRVGQRYGRVKRDGKQLSAHRVSYEAFNGPIPEGLLVRHLCDNPRCVNPDHLVVGTQGENVADRVYKGRSACGSRIRQAKLTEADVVELRGLFASGGYTQKELAVRYGIAQTTVSQIIRRDSWRHV